MAKSIGNLILKGASGQIGKQIVVRTSNGRTILASYPISSKTYSEKQKSHFEKFKNAVAYAKTVLKNPETSKIYQSVAKDIKGVSPYNLAVKDYLKPSVGYVDMAEYKGIVGNTIRIYTDSILPITNVSVKIKANDLLIEASTAERLEVNEWVYTIEKANTDLDNTTIDVTYTNSLGRKVVKTYRV